MPTLLAISGQAIPDSVDGENLLPVLRGEAHVSRPWLHGEHAPCYGEDQAYHFLTDGRRKYIWRPLDGSEQFFDLETDPRELRDLAANREYAGALASWRRRLVVHLQDRKEGFSDGDQLLPGRPYTAWVGASQP